MTWEPDRKHYPVRGIDVSHHQGEIDWQKVAQNDVAFAYIKATEGTDFKDKAFSQNWRQAKSAGLAHGAYHFFSYCSGGADQAVNFLETIPLTEVMLPPVLDIETPENCPDEPSKETILREVSAFITFVEEATNQQVLIYVPEDIYLRYLAGMGLNRRIWVQSEWRTPDYVTDWSLWQFSNKGSVDGISGNVDLNVLAEGLTLDRILR